MPQKITTWQCQHCNTSFDCKEDASECESACSDKKHRQDLEYRLRKLFPPSSIREYNIICASCHKLLRDYHKDWDPCGRNMRGDLKKTYADSKKIFNADFCMNCYWETLKIVVETLEGAMS